MVSKALWRNSVDGKGIAFQRSLGPAFCWMHNINGGTPIYEFFIVLHETLS